ncbi:MAG: Ger(x)C family spore germination C-terminal domain-containing protein [Christensenellales bacterium]
MKKIKEFLMSHKYLLLLIVFFVILIPMTISTPAQADTRAIVTGVSIDKSDKNFVVGLQLISPQSNISNNENLQIVEDEGESFYDCIVNLSLKLGKIIGFEHTNIIIFGEQLEGVDVMNLLDYLYRNHKIEMSTILVQCKGKAKRLLETSAELNNNSSSSLQNNLGYNSFIKETANTTSMGDFFNQYHSFSGISVLSVIETPSQEGGGGDSSGQGQNQSGGQSGQSQTSGQGGSSSGQGSTIEPLIQNNGEGAVFKNGKFVEIISRDLIKGFSWPHEKSTIGLVEVENIKDNNLYNAKKVLVKVENSKSKINSKVNNNDLILNVDLKLYCFVAEIVDADKKTQKVMGINEDFLSQELKERIEEEVSKLINNSLAYSKEKNLDIFGFYDRFYKFNNKDFRKVLNEVGENYLNYCKINLNIEVAPFK